MAGNVAAVYQSAIWQQAASYLTQGESTDAGNTSGYAAAISDLIQLASIPEMDVTPLQNAEGTADVNALSIFFDPSSFSSGQKNRVLRVGRRVPFFMGTA